MMYEADIETQLVHMGPEIWKAVTGWNAPDDLIIGRQVRLAWSIPDLMLVGSGEHLPASLTANRYSMLDGDAATEPRRTILVVEIKAPVFKHTDVAQLLRHITGAESAFGDPNSAVYGVAIAPRIEPKAHVTLWAVKGVSTLNVRLHDGRLVCWDDDFWEPVHAEMRNRHVAFA